MKTLVRLIKEEQGQGMAEYGLLIAGIALIAIGAIFALGDKIGNLFNGFSFDKPTT